MEELSSECEKAIGQFKSNEINRREVIRALFALGVPASAIYEMIGEAEAQNPGKMVIDPADLKAQFDRLALIISTKAVSDALSDILANEDNAAKQAKIASDLANTFKDAKYYSENKIPLKAVSDLRFSMRVFELVPDNLETKLIYAERYDPTGHPIEKGVCISYGEKLCASVGVP
jgi:hypothetical protein